MLSISLLNAGDASSSANPVDKNSIMYPTACLNSYSRVFFTVRELEGRFASGLLLDGARDEVEKHRFLTKQKNVASSRFSELDSDNAVGERSGRGTMLQTFSATQLPLVDSWNPVSSGQLNDGHECQFVFLSHGDKHTAFVRQLSLQLSEAGIACYPVCQGYGAVGEVPKR
ncbi:unnamed protein product [Phytophthora fragariaefolia]|uniref:Unnamed protein product n=1 Tax=Phytophthora fragariaefolia TaxID=1490495 RepID=A0A9W7D6B9_9STRA|nr:unnamed protein product [Phytophthora fragariaefolia]